MTEDFGPKFGPRPIFERVPHPCRIVEERQLETKGGRPRKKYLVTYECCHCGDRESAVTRAPQGMGSQVVADMHCCHVIKGAP